jgi:zinc-ribbon domain
MAFCNSCGTNLEVGVRFCPKCGAVVPMASAIPATVTPSATSPQPNNALKIILIVVAAIVVLGILGIGTLGFVVRRIAQNSRIKDENGKVRVETPFGTVQSTNDPEEAARNLGVDPYPGARVLQGNSATIGGMRTVTAQFESDDSVDKVAAFYSSKLPNARVNTKDQNHCTIVSTDKKNIVTINIAPEGNKSQIDITTVTGKNLTGDSSSD